MSFLEPYKPAIQNQEFRKRNSLLGIDPALRESLLSKDLADAKAGFDTEDFIRKAASHYQKAMLEVRELVESGRSGSAVEIAKMALCSPPINVEPLQGPLISLGMCKYIASDCFIALAKIVDADMMQEADKEFMTNIVKKTFPKMGMR